MKQIICPCCSIKTYDLCCQPFHQGVLPDAALKLMRSRYTAYALNIPGYIIKTTHPANPLYQKDQSLWIQQISAFSLNTHFKKLEILDFTEATVTFTAHLSQNTDDATFTEKSEFERVEGIWLYRSGHVFRD